MKKEEILICIFNYRKDENARRLLNSLSPYFDTVVLDSGNDKVCKDFIQFDNIYYGGLWNEAKKLSEKKDYKYVGIITSDVLIDDKNISLLINKLNWLLTTSNVGVFSVIGDKNGHSNRFQYAEINGEKFRYSEGFFQFIKIDVLKKQNYITIDKYIGYGIDFVTCFLSNKLGYKSIIDDNIYIYHPNGKGYNKIEAIKQQKEYYSIIKNEYPDFVVKVREDVKVNNEIENRIKVLYKENDGLSIIISAYHTEKYIKETLDSIYKQDYIKHNNNFEVIIGIDGCKETFNELKKIYRNYKNLKVLNMCSNRGTFVTSNTLVYQSKFNKILRFDSDDILADGSLSKIMEQSKQFDIIRFKYYDFKTLNDAKKMNGYAYGSVLYDKKVFETAGGYQDWKCSGDYEFFERVKNSFSLKEIDECLYYHRLRNDSLMHDPDTAMNSPYRLKLNSIVKKYNFKKGDNIKIPLVTNSFVDIEYIEKMIITMTTWQKRIQNIPDVLSSILNGTVKPDKIVLNLSIVNFPLKEDSFPINVKNYLNQHKDIVEINWLKYDTKVWKKSVPTLYKYPNDCIICIDDDFIYPNDFLETFIKAHKENPYTPISGVNIKIFENNIQHCGCASLDKLGFFKNLLDKIPTDIFDNGDEDTFFTWCYKQMNNQMIFCGKKYHTNMEAISNSTLTSYSKTEKINPYKTWQLCKNYKEENNDIIKYICCDSNSKEDITIKRTQTKEMDNNITNNLTLYRTYYLDTQFKSYHLDKDPNYVVPINTNDKKYQLSSKLNKYWSEYALMTEIAKEGKKTQYVGFDQFAQKLDISIIIDNPGYDIYFNKSMKNKVLKDQYNRFHCKDDMDNVISILNELYGNGNKYTNALTNKTTFYYESCFIMKWEIFNDFCNFLSEILDKLDKKYKLEYKPEKYKEFFSNPSRKYGSSSSIKPGHQDRAFGFLSERLLSIFISENYKNTTLVLNEPRTINTSTVIKDRDTEKNNITEKKIVVIDKETIRTTNTFRPKRTTQKKCVHFLKKGINW